MGKLLVLAAAGYFLYRFLTGGGKEERPKSCGGREEEGSDVDDVLMEDPVCHTYVPARDALCQRVDGRTYYFCSQECRDQFNKGADA